MEHIDNLLQKIKDKYGIYIGKKSVRILSTFLSGYICAVYELTGDKSILLFNSKFQLFVEKRNNLNFCNKHWSEIIAFNRSEEEAFDQFFYLYEEYKSLEEI